VLSALSTLAKGHYSSGATRLAARASAPARTGTHSSPATTPNTSGTGPPTGGVRTLASGAVRIGSSTQLAPDQDARYTVPGDKQPDIIIRQSDRSLNAFSAICTHQGCQVGYQGAGQNACRCHGGFYNARTGALQGGPPPAPLPRRRVLEHGGRICAIPS
jgi:cytochrome b6-f complex iron-sulfur subunit